MSPTTGTETIQRRIRRFVLPAAVGLAQAGAAPAVGIAALPASPTAGESSNIPCDMLYEHPTHTDGFWPGMRQSLLLSQCAHQSLHKAIAIGLTGQVDGWRDSFWTPLSITVGDLAFTYMPLGMAWLHEEWHRSVMGIHGIWSYNGVNDLPFGAEVIAVSHVSDRDLTRLKARSPEDFVRLAAAGAEAQGELALLIEKYRFQRRQRTYDLPTLWFSTANVIAYIHSGSASHLADSLKAGQSSQEEGERDFVGHDFSSWVYDLHRPDEPYAARGRLPDGSIDRYRGRSDLSDQERKFLALQGRLAFVNLADPFLWGFDRFHVNGFDFNARLAHQLTSFGHDLAVNVFAAAGGMDWHGGLHLYRNAYRTFPGIEVSSPALRLPREGLHVEAAGMLWQQPDGQKFKTTAARWGGLLRVSIHQQWGHGLSFFTELEAKTQGWVAGNPLLGSGAFTRLGLRFEH